MLVWLAWPQLHVLEEEWWVADAGAWFRGGVVVWSRDRCCHGVTLMINKDRTTHSAMLVTENVVLAKMPAISSLPQRRHLLSHLRSIL